MLSKVSAVFGLLSIIAMGAVPAHACNANVDVTVRGDNNQVKVIVIPSPGCNKNTAPSLPSSYWTYHGSVFGLVANGARRQFVFVEPRDGLVAVGVTRGMTEFEGRRIGDTYEGTAYVFSKKCGPIGYPVTGYVSNNNRRVTLTGFAPYVDTQCRIVSGRDAILSYDNIE
jgi:hypothetical protein